MHVLDTIIKVQKVFGYTRDFKEDILIFKNIFLLSSLYFTLYVTYIYTIYYNYIISIQSIYFLSI